MNKKTNFKIAIAILIVVAILSIGSITVLSNNNNDVEFTSDFMLESLGS